MKKENALKQKEAVKNAIIQKLNSQFGRNLKGASKGQIYKATAMVLRDRIMEEWAYSKERTSLVEGKELYYLSMEFLMGRSLGNNLIKLDLFDVFEEALQDLGFDLMDIRETEANAGLGNGGLGRLAACFLDSLATLGYSGHGNGIRYEYGLFKQKIVNGFQLEQPDPWLEEGNVWEVAKTEEPEIVCFGGTVEETYENGRLVFNYKNCQCLKAVPYDMPIIGYGGKVVNTLRLWGAKAMRPLDMGLFGRGQYNEALAEKETAEIISKVLYPDDNHPEGKVLRLKQQYFFVSASIQSIISKYKRAGRNLEELPSYCVIHINDTHPALAIPEMMRILMDKEGFDWDKAWDIVTKIFAYTNHTILEEAMEKWPADMIQSLLPRVYMILHEINERFCKQLWNKYPGDWQRISSMAIIAHGQVKMAHLCIAASFSINGVAKLHTNILKKEVFANFYHAYPKKFQSITNGIDHRRFLLKANPKLSQLITESIGDRWILNSMRLKDFERFKEDAAVQEAIKNIRYDLKVKLAQYIQEKNNVIIDPASIFDVQVKRLHEYKRQLLNVLHILYLYHKLQRSPDFPMHPRTFIFAAKAAPGYHNAKLIIKLIHAVGERINNDKAIKDKIKVIFLEDYSVSLAEKVIPASDISQQISTAGKEASGTGNMKFMINGALTIGTLDGANVEMKEAVGGENIFIFGLTADETANYYKGGHYRPREIYDRDPILKEVMEMLIDGSLDWEYPDIFRGLYNGLLNGNGGMADQYFVLKDFESYYNVNARVGQEYWKPSLWWKKSIVNISNAGYFSSDRTIEEYSKKIWKL